ncbi:Late embryoproteinsis abundant (LEA) hydroxyproline-rich glycoprotein family, putative isoform 1 [Hibiscus syriacus]|uniref:Late embryoproteinsis abundant (LEA) hydroxyproline-rich glycoprotein family, putative isoform 1 n=1 Tax=Hibiscus syriacus TaxID=106335 RepID=A0A6A3B6W7_HIBSY|nr:Late embryoproteinsis abundant (LEA) hydroxyproline-rich glycoprotein family, putative isoform 1 [Hibiscus syriacus]
MGASASKVEEDQALQLCRERKKYVRQALDGRCLLAAAHVAYIETLKSLGTALRKFVELETPAESSLYTSTNATPEPFALTGKSLPSFHTLLRLVTTKVEEKPPVPNIRLVTSSSTPQNTTTRSTEKPESSPFDTSPSPSGTPEWDFFGLWHPNDHQLSFQEGKEPDQGPGTIDDLDDIGKRNFFQSWKMKRGLLYMKEKKLRVQKMNSKLSLLQILCVASETDFVSREKNNSPDLSPLQGTPRCILSFSCKASDSGKEVPRMLEANKLHVRPIFPGKGLPTILGRLTASIFFRACFSCGEDPSQVKEELPQSDAKYLIWHRTTSSRSSSSGNPLGLLNTKDDVEDLNNNLFYNACMISGSHASTLDRLYAWERKLYDEVKASETVRSEYDLKCKFLRHLESRAESSSKIDKTRAVVKDLHSRIRVAIQRIHSISKRIEDLRDNELQPQLEELIEGLSRMWEVMSECHRRQFQIISVAYKNATMKISALSESHRPITAHLEHELSLLFSSFTKWIGSLKAYLKAINSWLGRCVSIPQKLKRSKRKNFKTELLRARGPPIYKTCGSWFDKLDALEPSIKQVFDSIKRLAADTSGFLPHQEKNEGKNANRPYAPRGTMTTVIMLSIRQERMLTSLVFFIGQLKSFAESSMKMYAELDREIQQAKHYYELYVKGAEVGNEENNLQSNDQSNNQSCNQTSDQSKDQLKPRVKL